jgi:broad specificity phosphatase PhoE
MGTLFLVRHATTAASRSGVNLGQKADAPLVGAGRALGARTGAAIRAELDLIGAGQLRMLTSPARRCRETARLVARALDGGDLEPEAHDGLWEIDYGAWEGLSAEECRRRDPELRARWEADPYATRTPGGESGSDVAARAFAALGPLEAWLAGDRGAAAVVVTHNHVVRLRIAAQLGIPMADYRRRVEASPGGYSMITFGPARATVRRLNVLPPGAPAAPA